MKKVILMLGTVVLAGFAPVDKVEPVLEDQKKTASYSGTSTAPTCPFYAPSSSSVVDSNEVAPYVHCVKCQQGVMTEHTDGEVKCTFCGEKN